MQGMFEGAASFYRDISGWTLADNANTTGMFTGADTWLSRVSRADGSDTTDGPPSRLGRIRPLLGRTSACCRAGALHAGLASTTARATTRRSVWTPSATRFGTRDALKSRGGQLPRRRCHRRGVLQPRRGLRRRGDCRDADWDVSLVTRHERAVLQQRILQRGYIAMGHLERHDHVPDVPRCQGVQPRYRRMGYLERHDHERDVLHADAFNQHLSRWDVSSVTTMQEMFCRRQRIQHDAGGLGHIQSHGFS